MLLFPESITVNWLDGVREKTLFMEVGTGELLINCDGELSRLSFPAAWTPRFTGENQAAESGFRLLLDTEGRLPAICALFSTKSLMGDSR